MINIKTRGQNQVVERKNKKKPPNGGSACWAEEQTKTRTNPQMGSVFVKQKKRKKRKNGQPVPVLGTSTHWGNEKWTGPKTGASTRQQKEKRKTNQPPKWGPALVERKKKEEKNKPPNGGSVHWAKEQKKKETPKWGWGSLSKEKKRKKNEWLAPKTGAIIWAIETSGTLFVVCCSLSSLDFPRTGLGPVWQ